MTASDPSRSGDGPESRASSRLSPAEKAAVHELVMRCFERMEKEGHAALEAMCAEHQEHAALPSYRATCSLRSSTATCFRAPSCAWTEKTSQDFDLL